MWPCIIIALALRLLLYSVDLTEVPEFVTPLSSMHRIQEGISLARSGVSPYSGHAFHQPPLILALLWPFFDHKGSTPRYAGLPLQLLFFIADVLVAYMLRTIMLRKLLRDARLTANTLEPKRDQYFLPSWLRDAAALPNICAAAYLLHPFALCSNVAWDVSSLVRVATVGSVYFATTSRSTLACICLALSCYVEIHPIIFVVATSALEMSESRSKERELKAYLVVLCRQMSIVVGVWFVLQACTWYVLHFYPFFHLDENQQHVNLMNFTMREAFQSSYVWHLTAQDYTPNVGIHWYLFSMLFERFRPYFTFAFNIQLFVYVAPLVVRVRGRPLILLTVLTSLVALLRPYPTLGDFSLPSVLMLMHPHVVARMRQKSVLVVSTSIGVALLPTMWYLWLYPGAACANHYYFSQLTYTTSLLLVVSEFLGAALLRDRQIEETEAEVLELALQALEIKKGTD
jgi:GPI-anchor transamidase subunit U